MSACSSLSSMFFVQVFGCHRVRTQEWHLVCAAVTCACVCVCVCACVHVRAVFMCVRARACVCVRACA